MFPPDGPKIPLGLVEIVGRDEAERCLPALPCGTLLLGDVRKNGAVELRVPALRW